MKESQSKTLLGRKREILISEISEKQDYPFDTLSEMSTSEIDLSQQLLTETIEAQKEVEDEIREIYAEILESGELPVLNRKLHEKYLKMALGRLPSMFKVLDASQPWVLYWVINSLFMLKADVSDNIKKEAGAKIISFIHEDGGIGGGLGQIGHAAATYAGLNTLVLLQDESLWSQLNRDEFYQWLLKLKNKDGSFSMHIGGETDTRAVYCVLVIASLLDILTPELVKGTAEWLVQCQTFEGGFGGVPFDEAHGGYLFCAVAALVLLDKLDLINTEKLVEWIATKQMPLEGGFQGRSNKLVDGCYSFWVGGVVGILDTILGKEIISKESLNAYILNCCQNPKFGGLRDKPGKNPDYYHSNYVILGLSVAQNDFYSNKTVKISDQTDNFAYSIESNPNTVGKDRNINQVAQINPVFALPQGLANKFKLFWKK